MSNREEFQISYSNKKIAKNTIYNLFGYGIPAIFAVFFIPALIHGLGVERFGILSLAWIVIGYFSFFDFGIGKSLTKIIAEKIGQNKIDEIPGIFWNSMFLMFFISAIITIVFLFLAPALVKSIFTISMPLRSETLSTFYLLALSIPLVTTSASLRGLLEAYQRFGIINIIRIILGIFTFLGPLIVLLITNSLFWIVCFLILIRFFIWILYFIQCIKANIFIKNNFKLKFEFRYIKPVLKFSIWITIANIIGPIILYSDRFFIGSMISAAAITFYVTPYEIATKLMLIPSALVGVLFPVFSAGFINNPELSKKLLLRGIKFICLIVFPAVFLMVIFSYEGIEIWLGEGFAQKSSIILKFLSIGILMNSFSLVPNNFFQGIGKPHIPTIINLIELPIYLATMWLSIKYYSLNGAAAAYMSLAFIDTTIMYIVAYKMFKIKFDRNFSLFLLLTICPGIIFPFFLTSFITKVFFSIIFLIIFFIYAWKKILLFEEKNFIFQLKSRLFQN